MQSSRKPEVMSPAGYWPQLRAAIEAGADSVYFGLRHFTARAKVGFGLDELPDVMNTLHSRGVRGFVTFNTLVFEHELEEAGRAIAAIARAGADALIVQDFGVVRMAREIAPDLELHASTQMSITNAEGVRLAQSLGMKRVTLARELSLDETRRIIASTDCEIEIFVHGALCVAYSGQCFSSEAWGGRSANRGQCAQACRLPYELLVDGRVAPLGDARYLLSPGDLYALKQIPEIVKMGVAALKIEGRYKDADYVALATAAYRKAVDESWAGRELSVSQVEEKQLEQVYSRGLGPFFLTGTNHQAVVRGRAPRHRGVLMGTVLSIGRDVVVIEPSDTRAKPGDGLVFDAASWRSPQEDEEGGRVYQVLARLDGRVELRFGKGAVNFARIREGDMVWRTHDPELDRAVKPYLDPAAPLARQAVDVVVTAREGEPLRAEWRLGSFCVSLESPQALGPAKARALSEEMLREQFGRLGGTAYKLGELTATIEGAPFAPVSMLNDLRREAVLQLEKLQRQPLAREVRHATPIVKRPPVDRTVDRQLHVLVRNGAQLGAALAVRPDSITLDYLDLYGLRPSVERVKAAGISARVAAPRVLKPGEARIQDFLLDLECPILVRSAGMLHALKSGDHAPLIADFSLNAANALTAEMVLELGAARLTPTHDLNADQISGLAAAIGAANLEVVAYQHLPVFHTEHCVFCRFMSAGTSYKDCGRPCESHEIALRDEHGRAHPVIADVGCRNTVFGAEAQEASAHLGAWLAAGIRHFRIEFVHESPEQLTRVARAWRKALAGELDGERLGVELKRIAPEGTTEGSLFVPKNYLTLPVLQ